MELSESSDPKSKTDDRLLTSNGDSHMLSAPSNGRNVLLDQSQINRQLNNVPQRNFLGIFKPVDADGSSTESDSRPPYSRANSADGAQVPSSPLKTMFDSDNEALATLNDVESVARVGDIQHSTLGRPTWSGMVISDCPLHKLEKDLFFLIKFWIGINVSHTCICCQSSCKAYDHPSSCTKTWI